MKTILLLTCLTILFTGTSCRSAKYRDLEKQYAAAQLNLAGHVQEDYQAIAASAALSNQSPGLNYRYSSIQIPAHESEGIKFDAQHRVIEIVE